MLYEEYAKKISKYVAIRDAILKYKILILSIIGAFVVLLSGFLATKGIFTGEVGGATAYTYGETVRFEAKALFSDVSFEYVAKGGSEWTSDAPVMPGEYQVRAVSNRSFGKKGYSDSCYFVINKKAVTLSIVDDSVQWYTSPTVNADGLVRSDTLDGVSIDMDNMTLGTTEAQIVLESVVIVDRSGADVTEAYELSAEPKDIEVTAREITLRASDVTREYDGTEIVGDGYTVTKGEPVDGHTFSVSYNRTGLIEVGTANISIAGVSIYEGETDVTLFYNISLLKGTATVEPRTLVIKTDGAAKEYDGKELTLPDWYISEGSKLESHVLTVNTYDGAPLLEPAYEQTFIKGYTLTDKDGNDMRGNYAVRVENASLSVTPRKLTVTTPSAHKVYDGTYLDTYGEYIFDNIADGQEYLISDFASIKDAKTVENSVVFTIMQGNENVTHCYDITRVFGELTVTKRSITVAVEAAQKEYDGEALAFSAPSIINGNLAEGDYIEYILSTYEPIIRPVKITKYISRCLVTVKATGEDVNKNYNVTIENGTLEVTKRALTISTESKYKEEYDGIPLTPHTASTDRLVSGHELTDIVYSSLTNAGEIENRLISFRITDASGNDVTECYKFDYAYGKLKIDKRIIKIRADEIIKDYDGEMVVAELNKTYFVTEGSVIDGHTLVVDMDGTYINACARAKYGLDVKVIDRYGDDHVTSPANYDIQIDYTNAYITIGSRNVTIYANDISVDYDGNYHDIYRYRITGVSEADKEKMGVVIYSSLNDGDQLLVDFNRLYIDAGEYTYSVTCVIMDMYGDDVSHNYVITVIYTDQASGTSKFVINKLDITVTANDSEKYYDARYVTTDDCLTVVGSTVLDETLLLSLDRVMLGAGVYEYSVSYDILNSSYEDRSHNYNVTVIYTNADGGYSTYTVKQRPIDVTTGSADFEYDGEEHWYTFADIGNMGLVSGHYLEYGDYTTIKELGEKDNELEFIIRDEFGENVTSNYTVTSETIGKLRVTPRQIIAVTPDAERVYDNTKLSKTDDITDLEGKVLEGHSLVLKPNTEYTEIGPYVSTDINVFEVTVVDENGKDVSAYYEIVDYIYGTLTITKRPVIIATESSEKIYDGTSLYTAADAFEISGVLDIHTVDDSEIKVIGKRTGVGTSKNGITGTVYITDKEGTDMSGNYEVSLSAGMLTVKPITLVARPFDVSCDYNGKAHPSKGGTMSNTDAMLEGDSVLRVLTGGTQTDAGTGTSYVTHVLIKTSQGYYMLYESVDGISAFVNCYTRSNGTETMYIPCEDGTYIAVTVDDEVSVYTGSVLSENCMRIVSYVDADGESARYAYYAFKNETGNITVNPATVVITCDEIEATYYEGITLSGGYRITVDNLADGHYINAPTQGSLNSRGTVTVTIDTNEIRIYSNEKMSNEYDITDQMMSNYNFVIIDGYIKIN